MSIVVENPSKKIARMRWRSSYLIFVVVENMKNSVSKPVKVLVTESVSFQNLNLVVAALREAIRISAVK